MNTDDEQVGFLALTAEISRRLDDILHARAYGTREGTAAYAERLVKLAQRLHAFLIAPF